ncbi:MAG: c-type cytochrome [Blastocatellia bacterium]
MNSRAIKLSMVGVTAIFTCLPIFGRAALQKERTELAPIASAPLGAPADGGALYSKYCSRCHGKTGNAVVDFCSPDWQKSHTNNRIATTIKNGKDGTSMPAFKSYLGANDVSALVHQIRSFGRRR